MKLNESQSTVRFIIMSNPINRSNINNAASELYNSKIKKGIKHDGQPLLDVIRTLIWQNAKDLSVEERVQLQVSMYLEALDNIKELA